MDHFYTPPELIGDGRLTLEGEESAHCVRVLRKKTGEEILVADGAGTAYNAVIEEVRARTVICRITRTLAGYGEPGRRLHLAVALLKNTARYDLLVEKCTELGMAALTPLITERTIPRHARTDRWRKIALAAMKQSQRSLLPRIREPLELTELLRSGAEPERFIAHEQAAEGFPAAGRAPDTLILVGPEGGFTAAEVQTAERAGCRVLRLGRRRLRTETAAIVAAALALATDGGAVPA